MRSINSSRLETLSSLANKLEEDAKKDPDKKKKKDSRKKKNDNKNNDEKDFLSRNKELAAEGTGAEVAVRMTEEEKKRLLELLADVEAELSLETIDEADEESHAMQVLSSQMQLATKINK